MHLIQNPIIQALLGITVFFGVAILLSENRRQIRVKHVALGLALEIGLVVIITQFPKAISFFQWLSRGIEAIKDATLKGTSFVFGYLGSGPAPFEIPGHLVSHTFIFVFQALPMILVISALSALLFHWKFIPWLVRILSKGLQNTLNIGGPMGIVGAAKIFLGQIETALLVKPYLKNFNRSELFMVLTCSMATSTSVVWPLYGMLLNNQISHPISHFIIASIINIPAAITIARIMVPATEQATSGSFVSPHKFTNSMDAVLQGTNDGVNIFWNIAGMLIVMIALVALTNNILELLPMIGGKHVSLQLLFSYIMAPIAWLMGIPAHETMAAGQILGIKTVLNEIFGFIELGKSSFSAHTRLILTYAVCNFCNFAAIALTISAFGSIVPERRDVIVRLGFRSLIAGILASSISATLMGIMSRINPMILGS